MLISWFILESAFCPQNGERREVLRTCAELIESIKRIAMQLLKSQSKQRSFEAFKPAGMLCRQGAQAPSATSFIARPLLCSKPRIRRIHAAFFRDLRVIPSATSALNSVKLAQTNLQRKLQNAHGEFKQPTSSQGAQKNSWCVVVEI